MNGFHPFRPLGSAAGDPNRPHPGNPTIDVWGRPIAPGTGWGFGNPEWEALYKGQSTIEVIPSSTPNEPSWWGRQLDRALGRVPASADEVKLVPTAVYGDKNAAGVDVPTQDLGITCYVGIGENGNPARQAWRTARSMLAYVMVPSPDQVFGLAVVDATRLAILAAPPVQAAATVPPVGGAISIAQIAFGHLGVQQQALFDVPPAQVVRVPFGGSFGSVNALLVPKYWTPDDAGNPRIYLTTPTGVELTSAIWNTLSAQALLNNLNGDLLNAAGTGPNPNKVPFSAYVAESPLPNQAISQPTRRFYGSIAVKGGTIGFKDTKIPVAWFASQVTLVGDPQLTFTIQTLTTGAGALTFGPFNFNAPVTMPAGATAIVVHDPVGIGVAGAVTESLFEADFTLSF